MAGIGITSPNIQVPYFSVGGPFTDNSHSLVATDGDTFLKGKLEVDGVSYFDNSLVVGANIQVVGNGVTAGTIIPRNTNQTNESLCLHTGSTNAVLVTEHGDTAVDFGHAAQINPTIFLQSADATDITQFISFVHDQSDGVINTGKGDLVLAPATNIISFGVYTGGAASDSTGYITVKDAAGVTRKLMVQA